MLYNRSCKPKWLVRRHFMTDNKDFLEEICWMYFGIMIFEDYDKFEESFENWFKDCFGNEEKFKKWFEEHFKNESEFVKFLDRYLVQYYFLAEEKSKEWIEDHFKDENEFNKSFECCFERYFGYYFEKWLEEVIDSNDMSIFGIYAKQNF